MVLSTSEDPDRAKNEADPKPRNTRLDRISLPRSSQGPHQPDRQRSATGQNFRRRKAHRSERLRGEARRIEKKEKESERKRVRIRECVFLTA